jgi:hypothetical protein
VHLLGLARVAREAGDRLLEPIDPLRAGSGVATAADLFRQGVYWVLLIEAPELEEPSFESLWRAASGTLDAAMLVPDERGHIESLLLAEPAFARYAKLPPTEQVAAAELLRALLDRLMERFDAPSIALRRAYLSRFLRLSLLAGVVAALTFGIILVLNRPRPDIASGKPWSTSSVLSVCHPEIAECGGTKTRIFFHTREEKNPWIEFDLGSPMRFSSLTVQNRTDYSERAVPLVVEVSDDRTKYRQVARREDDFGVWHAKFSPQTARYVRLRVDRRSFLHLEGVQIHP